jgi:hypothetical protein
MFRHAMLLLHYLTLFFTNELVDADTKKKFERTQAVQKVICENDSEQLIVNRRFILTSEFFLLRCYSNSLP